MAYVPNNLQIFTAAFAGALAGMGASDRVPTNPLSASYSGLASVAGAFAQSFDTEWGIDPETLLDIETTQELCEVAWQDRAPQAVAPFITPSTYSGLSRALIAMIKAGEAYFAGQGIAPPATPGLTPLATVAPVNVTKSAAVIGVSTEAARADHKHDITTAVVGNVIATANAEGVASSLARSDHGHNLPFSVVQTVLAAATGDVAFNSNKITGVDDPTLAQDVATKAYVDAASTAPGGVDEDLQINQAGAFAGVGGVDGEVLCRISGAWEGANQATFMALAGGTPSTDGSVRLPYFAANTTIIGGRRALATEATIIKQADTELLFGDITASRWSIVAIAGDVVNAYSQFSVRNYLAGAIVSVTEASGFCISSGGSTGSYGSGVGVLSILNAGTLVTTNPVGGSATYCEAGATKTRGTGGTVTTIAPA